MKFAKLYDLVGGTYVEANHLSLDQKQSNQQHLEQSNTKMLLGDYKAFQLFEGSVAISTLYTK